MKRLALYAIWVLSGAPVGTVHAQSEGVSKPAPPPPPSIESKPAPAAAYGARAHVREPAPNAQPTEAEMNALEADLGDSFSLSESLPGNLPVFSGVPYLIARGATPSGSTTYYDGVMIPSAYHIALGPAVVNRHLRGKVQLYPGVSPARYGRHTGSTLLLHAPRRSSSVPQRELKLTLLDASGYLYVPEIQTGFAWRIGDPGLLMNLLGLDATLNYYDYQLRHEATLGAGTELVLLALGDRDHLGDRTAPEDDISLDFHRFMARLTHRASATTFGSQLVLGYDASSLGVELDGEGVHVSPSVFVEHALPAGRFRSGVDLMAMNARLHRPEGDTETEMPVPRGQNLYPADFLDNQPYASLPTRSMLGVYGELELQPTSRWTIELGARADAWLAGSHSEAAVSPSGRVTLQLMPGLQLHAALGLAHQTRGSPVPLPSLNQVSIDAGLERSIQAEAGVNVELLSDLQLEATYFQHHYDDVVYMELILDCEGNTDPEEARRALVMGMVPLCRAAGLPIADGMARGVELYLKRELTERVAGFLSYTLTFADATARDGTKFTPQADVRHLLNAVLRVDLGAGFALGARMHFRTGKMAPNLLYNGERMEFERVESRLPSFFRGDIRGTYTWKTSFGSLQAIVEIQNVTASSEATNRDCLVDPAGDWSGDTVPIICSIDYQRAILLPNLGIRAEM